MIESPHKVEVPSQPEAKTVVCCSCSNSVRSRCTPAHGVVSPSQNVVGDMRREEGSTSSRADRYRWAKIRIPEFRGGDKWSSYLVQFRTIMKMHGCYDNDVMVFKLVETLRGLLLNTIIVCQLKPAVSFPPYALCLKDVLADRNLRRQR